MRRVPGLVGWLAVAAMASVISTAAVTYAGSAISDPVGDPLSAAEVGRLLAERPSATPGPASSPASSPTATRPTDGATGGSAGTTRVLSSAGGSVVARCAGGLVTLLSWSPAVGFEADDVSRGPAGTASLELKSDDDEYVLQVSCQAGVPTLDVTHDDRGGNSGPGGGDGSGDGGGPGPG